MDKLPPAPIRDGVIAPCSTLRRLASTELATVKAPTSKFCKQRLLPARLLEINEWETTLPYGPRNPLMFNLSPRAILGMVSPDSTQAADRFGYSMTPRIPRLDSAHWIPLLFNHIPNPLSRLRRIGCCLGD